MSDFLVPVDEEPELTPRGNGGGEMTLSETRVGDIVSMRRAARMMPRQPREVRQQIAEMAEMFGDEWEYRFPVRNSRSGQTEFIEGPTVGCSMAVARAYGNNDVAHTRTEDDGNSWIIYSTFVDLQTGFSLTRGFRQRKGQSRMGSDRARGEDIDFQIGVSKSTRNVVARALDDYVRYARQCARHRLVGAIEKRPDEYRERVKSYLSEIGYDLKHIEGERGAKLKDWTNEQIASVVRTLMAHKDGMLPDLDAIYRPKGSEPEAQPQEELPRAGPPTPRDVPQTAPGRPIEETGKRKRRTNREIDEETYTNILEIIDAATSMAEIDAVYAGDAYARLNDRAKDLADLITAAGEYKRSILYASIRSSDPDTDEGVTPTQEDASDFEQRHGRAAAEAVGATEPAPASEPTYKLLSLEGTLLEMLPAEEWFDELEERIGSTSVGRRERWLTVNQGIIQKILAERPDLSERLHTIVAQAENM